MNGYDLSRKWFDWCFENPTKFNPNHIALYFFCIEHCNRLGWKKEFGLPSAMTMEAIGVKSYNTYIKVFNDLVEFGFIKLVQRSKNQYTANIIALSNFDKAPNKALDKAIVNHDTKHLTKQKDSTIQSNYSIDKPINNKTIKPKTNKQDIPDLETFINYAIEKKPDVDTDAVRLKFESWEINNWKDGNNKPIKNWRSKLLNTLQYIPSKKIQSGWGAQNSPSPRMLTKEEEQAIIDRLPK